MPLVFEYRQADFIEAPTDDQLKDSAYMRSLKTRLANVRLMGFSANNDDQSIVLPGIFAYPNFGLQGIQGIQGIRGYQGLTGSRGVQGIKGPQGVTGIQGPKGSGASLSATEFANVFYQALSDESAASTLSQAILKILQDGNFFMDDEVHQKNLQPYLFPIGAIIPWTSTTMPNALSNSGGKVDFPYKGEWLECAGQSLERSKYPELFRILSTNYGSPQSNLHFYLPNLRGRFLVGKEGNNNNGYGTLNNLGGENKHILTTYEIPSHSHGIPGTILLGWYTDDDKGNKSGRGKLDTNKLSSYPSTYNSGGGLAHENRPPYCTIMWIIRAK